MNTLNSLWLPDVSGTTTLSAPYDPSLISAQAVSGSGVPFVKINSTTAITITLPQAIGLFGIGWASDLHNLGSGVVTVAAVTSTIEGAASVTISQHQTVRIISDGVNYETVSAVSAPLTPILDTATGIPIFDDTGNWIY